MTLKGNKAGLGWLTIAIVLLTGLVIALIGCGGNDNTISDDELSGSIKIIGSNTVELASVIWAEDFMKIHPKVSIAVSGPGSGVGIAYLTDNITDICQASRAITPDEIAAAEANGVNPYEIQVGIDALSVVVHPSNPVSELTFAQLSAVYTGKITNWKEVGGNDAEILVLSRDTNSGTHSYFKKEVVQMAGLPTEDTSLEYGPEVLFLPSTEQGVAQVAGNPNAIFYPGMGYVTGDVKALAIKQMADDPAVLPSLETALDGSYPISRPLFFYTDGKPEGVIKAFIDYCLSEEGQQTLVDVGYVPLP